MIIPSLILYTPEFIIDDLELFKYGQTIINQLSDHVKYMIDRFPEFHFNIYSNTNVSIEPYAIAVFQKGLFSHIFFNLKKAQGKLGIRETDKLSDILNMKINNFNIKDLVKKELNNYFGKADKTDKTDNLIENKSNKYKPSYKRQNDFSFDLVRLKDGLKAINPNHRNLYQLNKCDAGEGININEFARSLDATALPFHRCTINFDIMHSSINTLDSRYFSVLSVFYFPERKSKYPQEFKKINTLKDSNYQKAWRQKDKSLDALIDNILNTQLEQVS